MQLMIPIALQSEPPVVTLDNNSVSTNKYHHMKATALWFHKQVGEGVGKPMGNGVGGSVGVEVSSHGRQSIVIAMNSSEAKL